MLSLTEMKYLYTPLKCAIRKMHAFPKDKTYINGKWVSAKSGKVFSVTNPADGSFVANVPECDVSDLQEAIDGSRKAFITWSQTTAKERSAFLRKLFDLQMKNSDGLSHLLTTESGKVLNEAKGEISYGASFFEWFSEEARRIYGDIVPSPVRNREMFFIRQPIGVAGIITPWNFPNAMITRKVGAALAAGCTCIIKPAEDTPLCALAIAQLSEEAQIPPGVINVITSSHANTPSIGKYMCESPQVNTISFTGSTAVGKLLLLQSASTVKRVSLELGGNAPFIVFNSANISKAVEGALASKFRNSGQTCVCTNRFLVQEGIYDKFVSELGNAIQKKLCVGNGLTPEANIGPLINESAIEKVQRHVKDAVKKGAALVTGGEVHSIGNTFFQPTLLSGIKEDMLISLEETFGPVAGVMKFKTEEEVIKIANSARVGLAGYFYSEDYSQIWRVAKALEVGMVGVNEGIISCAEGAFGGIKESGLGREGSRYGIDEYVNIKYVCMGGMS